MVRMDIGEVVVQAMMAVDDEIKSRRGDEAHGMGRYLDSLIELDNTNSLGEATAKQLPEIVRQHVLQYDRPKAARTDAYMEGVDAAQGILERILQGGQSPA